MTGRARALAPVIAAALAALACAAGCETADFERMIEQSRYDTYEPAPMFEDGTIMRRPPAGTVPRGAVIGPAALTEGVAGGAYVEEIPIEVDAALVARGRDRFDIFCAACHGVTGTGDTQVAENMVLRPPPSLHEARIRAYPPGRLYRVIAAGYGLMPSYSARLSVRDRWAVVAYIEALWLSQWAAADALPEDIRQEAAPWLR